jgi:hypothetical protein
MTKLPPPNALHAPSWFPSNPGFTRRLFGAGGLAGGVIVPILIENEGERGRGKERREKRREVEQRENVPGAAVPTYVVTLAAGRVT